jgi:hypothetical protein
MLGRRFSKTGNMSECHVLYLFSAVLTS